MRGCAAEAISGYFGYSALLERYGYGGTLYGVGADGCGTGFGAIGEAYGAAFYDGPGYGAAIDDCEDVEL